MSEFGAQGVRGELPLVDVSIVIGADESLIFGCLSSLYNNNSNYISEVYVISNPASEQTLDAIRDEYPQVRLILNPKRKGFAENHNFVLSQSTAKYILVLNDDTVVEPFALDHMVEWAESHPDVGVVGPRLLNPDGTLQPSIYGYPTLLQQIVAFSGVRRLLPRTWLASRLVSLFRRTGSSSFSSHDRLQHVDSLKGACLLMRRDILDCAGYMDEVTYVYEEIEWLYRVKASGWSIAFLPYAEVVHYGGQTVTRTAGTELEMVKAAINFFDKHRSRWSFHLLRAFFLLLWVKRFVLATLSRNSTASRQASQVLKTITSYDKWLESKQRYFVEHV